MIQWRLFEDKQVFLVLLEKIILFFRVLIPDVISSNPDFKLEKSFWKNGVPAFITERMELAVQKMELKGYFRANHGILDYYQDIFANCTSLGVFLDEFMLLRAKQALFDKIKQLLWGCLHFLVYLHFFLSAFLKSSQFLSSAYGVSPGPTSRNSVFFPFCIQLSRRRRPTSRGVIRRS